jgi:hypothetical protein
LWLLKAGAPYLGVEEKSLKHMTIYFNTFILIQIWNEFNARKLHGETNVFSGFLTNSKPHAGVTVIMILFQVFAVQYGGTFMHTTPLTIGEWMFSIVVGSLCIPYGLLLNQIPLFKPEEAKPKFALNSPTTPVKTVRRLSDSPKAFVLHRKDTATTKMCHLRNSNIHISKEKSEIN